MKKRDLIDAVIETANRNSDGKYIDSAKMREARLQTEALLEAFGEVAAKELSSGGEITIPGLGKLKARGYPERPGRNPRTGATLRIPPYKRAVFTAFKSLKDALKT